MHLTVNFEPDKDYTKISVNDVITRLELGIIIISLLIILYYIILYYIIIIRSIWLRYK